MNQARIQALDGWRGIAILLVVLDHIQNLVLSQSAPRFPAGGHGVTAFFVLSGFLITNKLLEPGADLRTFYIRRLFRLMPVAWIFLIAVGSAGFLYRGHGLIPEEAAACVLCIRNYFGNFRTAVTTHFWSLSIEEQFYLIWPLILLRAGKGIGKWIAPAAALLSYAWYLLHRGVYDLPFANYHTEVRADALLVGCSIAIWLKDEQTRASFIRVLRWLFWPALAYLLWISAHFVFVPSLFECAAWGAVISYSAFASPRFLSFAPLTWLGRISYSVYIWNIFVMVIATRLRPPFGWILLLIPVASYYVIEKPGIACAASVVKKLGKTVRLTPAQVTLAVRLHLPDAEMPGQTDPVECPVESGPA